MKYVDVEELLKAQFRAEEYNQTTGDWDLPVVAVADIEAMPAADVVPVRHGTWEPLTETQESKRNAFAMYRCSVCGKKSLQHRMGDRFCSQCGAEMEQSPGFRYCPFYRNAEWIHSEGGEAHCSECGCTVYGNELSPYCPQCGANMETDA